MFVHNLKAFENDKIYLKNGNTALQPRHKTLCQEEENCNNNKKRATKLIIAIIKNLSNPERLAKLKLQNIEQTRK